MKSSTNELVCKPFVSFFLSWHSKFMSMKIKRLRFGKYLRRTVKSMYQTNTSENIAQTPTLCTASVT